MNDIYFKDEKFYLKNLPYISGITTVEIKRELKKSLRYQKLFLLGDKKYDIVDLSGKIGIISVSSIYDKAYVIVRLEKPKGEVTYDEEDIDIIKCFIHYFCDIKPEITERFCKSIGYNILSDYHKSFGVRKLEEFKASLFGKTPIKIGYPEPFYYSRPRYNVLSLMRDLKETSDLQIFTDPELVGKYKRISRKVEDGSTVLKDKWAKFMGISGNRTRANISINTFSKVKVVVPENSVGVEPGDRELNSFRSFTIVVDGKLNMKEIGIKTSNTRLIGKLKRLGLVEPMLFEGEYVVSLSSLPLFPKRPSISSYQLGYAEYKVREAEIRTKYISLLLYRQEKKLGELPRKIKEPEEEKSESTLFLENLGIYGNMYYPGRTRVEKSKGSYMATEIIGKFSGIPGDLYPNIRNFINTGSCKNAVILEALKDLAELREEKDLKILWKIFKEEEHKKNSLIKVLRSLKYRVISGKTLTFSDKQLEKAVVEVKAGVKVQWIVKDTEIEI